MAATKQQIIAALKRKYGTDYYSVGIQVNRHAKPKAEREAAAQHMKELQGRQKEIAAEQMDGRAIYKRLLAAARFVVDVNGDDPSIPQLREIVELCERQDALSAEWLEIRQKYERLRGIARCQKYDAYTLPAAGLFRHIVASGDTLDELLEEIDR